MRIINRELFLKNINAALKVNPIVALLGPRQCGKTTLAKLYAQTSIKKSINYLDLEDPRDLAKLDEPLLALENTANLTIIDEIQRRPELFPILRVLIDRNRTKNKFLILGSASRDLIKQTSETLAGRISYLELTPFNYREISDWNTLWLRGGFPNSYLAKSNKISNEWRQAYITTFLEKDIPNLGITIPAKTLRRFWTMLAHYHGNIFNASEIGKSLGIAHTTARSYLDLLTGTFMIRELNPWFENIAKRQIKAPKIYFRDSGIYHSLLGIMEQKTLNNNPKLGASWEGIAIEEVIRYHEATNQECYFWGIHAQAELDLFIIKYGKRLGFEIKYSDAPKLTRSMEIATEILKLDKLTVICPGNNSYNLTKNIQVIGLNNYLRTGTAVKQYKT